MFRDAKGDPISWLVEKWEQAQPNVLRLKLKKGVKFHNGEDFTAETVKFSMEQYTAPNSRSPWKNRMGIIKEYRILDRYTIEYVTEKPNRPLLRNTTSSMALSPKAFKDLGDKFATNPVGTGPMKFVEYRPGQHLLVEQNPDYWGQKLNFKRLRWRFIPEDGTRVAALEAGEVMMVNNVPPDQLPRLKDNKNLEVTVSRTNRVMFVNIDTRRKPFEDKRVRQAMNYAVDKEAIAKNIMGGMAPVAKAPLPEGLFGFYDGLTPFKYDPDKAKKLLADAGASGATINLGAPNGRYLLDKQVGEAIANFLSAVGFKVMLENPTWSTYVSEVTKYQKAKYDAYLFGWGIASEPGQEMSEFFLSKNAQRSGYSNPEVDKLIAEGVENFDEAKVKEAYKKAQEIIWEDCPWIWLYQQPDINAINKRLRNWTPGRTDEYLLFWPPTTLE